MAPGNQPVELNPVKSGKVTFAGIPPDYRSEEDK